MNALVIETAFLGDAIISLALPHEIKRMDPSARVSYLVRAGVEEVVAGSPDIDDVIVFDKRGSERGLAGVRAKASELSDLGFDTLFLLHSSRRSQTLVANIPCKVKIGFEGMAHAGLTHTVADQGWSNRYERAILPLRAIAANADISSLPRIVPPITTLVEEFMERWKICIVLAPGSAWATKKWGDLKFQTLAKALTARGIGVVVIGGLEEQLLATTIRNVCEKDSVLDLAGRATFLESVGAIKRASLLVANDSAPIHAAVAVGTRVLAIFGPTLPAFGFAPPTACGEVIELPELWCRPCSSHGSRECPTHTHACMQEIGVEEVFLQATKML